MPKWLVANEYLVRRVHEVEAETQDEAIHQAMEHQDEMNTALIQWVLGIRSRYLQTYVIQEIKEE